jgi:hypothetical protein
VVAAEPAPAAPADGIMLNGTEITAIDPVPQVVVQGFVIVSALD